MSSGTQQPESERTRERETELREWRDSLAYVLAQEDPERVRRLLQALREQAQAAGIGVAASGASPYINSIPPERQPEFPGDRELERRIKNTVRWNAMAMVLRANRAQPGIGGHISTFASAATLYEVGFNHFFRASENGGPGDHVYFQGHASPGNYARAFLEGRLSVEQLKHFRNECREQPGLSSYPHPWLMPDFWEFATVSMGLGPILAIYKARFDHYLRDRGLAETEGHKIWCFVGDGETDEPETNGAIRLAAREELDNLIFVINCNLQRLDGPVRGNGNIVQELETLYRGAGWNVIKVLWGEEMDALLQRDTEGLLARRMGEVVDGEYQNYAVRGGGYMREHFFGADPQLLRMVEHLSDEDLERMRLGGHDPVKVYAAYRAAVEHRGAPTVILARTIKGYGLGEAGEGRNVTHQQKKLNDEELKSFRSRFEIPLSDEDLEEVPFYRPPDDSPEMKYLHQRRKELGGYFPSRSRQADSIEVGDPSVFEESYRGSRGRSVPTTMAFVRLLSKLMKDPEVGKWVVPIVPDEARTFGMEALFRQVGIYCCQGQLYEPVDSDNLLYYREAKDGQILEEGISEEGSIASFVAAGTAYSTHGINTIPFFMFYSMFGFQRIGDLIWAAGDMRTRGFLVGGTAGRTTLAGEGLQHADGHSHLLAYPHPTLRAYDPAYAYEIAVIVEDGIRRMYRDQESAFYYFTMMNEAYVQPPLPRGAKEGILRGMHRVRESGRGKRKPRVRLLGSGAILGRALAAQELLDDQYGLGAEVWSVTSYSQLHRDALRTERWNRLHPDRKPRRPYLQEVLEGGQGVVVAATDYLKALPESIGQWVPGRLVSLGTDGFGRSDDRPHLRAHFEVDERHIAVGAMSGLAREGQLDPKRVQRAIKELDINPERRDPAIC